MNVYTKDTRCHALWNRKASTSFLAKLRSASWRERLSLVERTFPTSRAVQHASHAIQIRFEGGAAVLIDFPPYAYAGGKLENQGWRKLEYKSKSFLELFTAGHA